MLQQLFTIPLLYRWVITLSLAAAIVVLSVVPGKSQADDSIFVWLVAITPKLLQKSMHMLTYALLAFGLFWALEWIESRMPRFLVAFAMSVLLGTVLEWYQTRVPGRFGSLFDVLLNAVGTAVGLAFALVVI